MIDDVDFTLLHGNADEELNELGDRSVHCIVTSPPYFRQRAYGTPPQQWPDGWVGELGQEPSDSLYVEHLTHIFRRARRVLRDDGTLWLNLGDKMLDKEQLMIPAMAALALKEDGWRLRRDIIWEKPNAVPESVDDRPTSSHEHVFLFTKSARYFFDSYAIREPAAWEHWGEQTSPKYEDTDTASSWVAHNDRAELAEKYENSRNPRDVWHIATESYEGAHYAVFPLELPRRCIKAGTSEHGVCAECGAPWTRIVETIVNPDAPAVRREVHEPNVTLDGQGRNGADSETWGQNLTRRSLGWKQGCAHHGEPVPATVLDPFLGSGTTAIVARELRRRSIGIELGHDSVKLTAERTQQQSLLS